MNGATKRMSAVGLCLSLAMLSSSCATAPDAASGKAAYALMPAPAPVGVDYHIAPDDIVKVEVYREPGLSLEEATVSAAGNLRMALIGDVPVAGLSTSEAADVIAGRLGERYLVSPQVTVFIKKAVSRRITVDGEVREPGLFPIDGRITLMQAVAMAKGPTRLASLGEIVVVRTANGQRLAAMFNLNAIRAGKADDPEILPGDSIIVGLSRAKAILAGALLAAPALTTGFIALDGH
ncbi:MAG: polysaccharide biosynthesis/export family protein [Sphingobium sp.]|nr:polysaccharide biosynthesis/export family protein [Sphingobium sp.]